MMVLNFINQLNVETRAVHAKYCNVWLCAVWSSWYSTAYKLIFCAHKRGRMHVSMNQLVGKKVGENCYHSVRAVSLLAVGGLRCDCSSNPSDAIAVAIRRYRCPCKRRNSHSDAVSDCEASKSQVELSTNNIISPFFLKCMHGSHKMSSSEGDGCENFEKTACENYRSHVGEADCNQRCHHETL